MRCLLIANANGLFSALPTVEESGDFKTDGMFTQEVEVTDTVRALVFQERGRIRVLAEGLPVPQKKPNFWRRMFRRKKPLDDFSGRADWLYVVAVLGRLVLV